MGEESRGLAYRKNCNGSAVQCSEGKIDTVDMAAQGTVVRLTQEGSTEDTE